MQLSDAYRRARRNTSIFCGIALAWSAAQFDVSSVSLTSGVNIDFSGASVPLILACGIIYTLVRSTIEYAMQPNEVRRWNLAQIDYQITAFLVRASILILAAAGVYRSVETVAYVIASVIFILVLTAFLVGVGGIVITPMLLRLKPVKGTPVGRMFEAERLAARFVVVLLIVALVGLGIGSLHYEPLRSLWLVPPSPTAVVIFITTAVLIVLSYLVDAHFLKALFANDPSKGNT